MKTVIWPQLFGKVVTNAAVQATLGNLELPSRILVSKFVTTQQDVDDFISSVHGYMFIGMLWTLGTTILMYVMHEYAGAIINFATQIMAMTWIISRKYKALRNNVVKYGLQMDSLFSFW